MFTLIRALVYATLFMGFLLLFLPAQILTWSGITPPASLGLAQWTGMGVGVLGFLLAVSCVLTFVVIGRGTAAPFDPPRRLVSRGPYRYVRNPMYIGAGLVLAGAALFYGSPWLWAYLGLLWIVVHLLVVLYEEPTLRRLFGQDYEDYTKRVERWWPSSFSKGVRRV